MSAHQSTSNDLPPEVQSWLDEHPGADAEPLSEVWQLSGEVPPVMDPDPDRIDAMRDDLRSATATDRLRTDAEEVSAEQASTTDHYGDRSPIDRMRSRPRWTGRLIGTAVLLVLLAAGLYLFAVPNRITVPPGQTQTVSLSDGSTLELNSGTTLRYPQWWPISPLRSWLGRSVHLEGEAFFRVAGTGTPFRVDTKNATLRVLGTRFNVRARRTDGRLETCVVVTEGRVALKANGKTVRLDSAQTATVQASNPPSSIQTARLDRALAWRRGGFSFTNASVRTVSAELSRRFDVPITVQSEVKGRPVTLHVDDPERPAALLRDVCRAAGCRIDSTAEGLVVRPR